jgi:F0F1-type ATP synthase membrane subunit c/vacuolar-type H+-ATPase subunit K
MRKLYNRVLISFSILLFSLLILRVSAQNISLTLIVEDIPSGPANGLIVIQDGASYKLSSVRGDSRMIGIITESPSFSGRKSNNPKAYYVNGSGTSVVRATNKNGKITKGDYLTSSDVKGVAIKTADSEFTIGVAQEDFDSADGLIKIDIKPSFFQGNSSVNKSLINVIRSGSQSFSLTPINSLRYVLAAIIGIASFLFGFSIFSKISGSGIQALGRNPLARKTIEFNIIIEFILNLGIIVFGLVISYFILTL